MRDELRGVQLAKGVRIVFRTSPPASHFFGYYDKCPLDATGTRLLCHRVTFDDNRNVAAGDSAELGVYHIESGAYEPIAVTSAFNWQLGSMLQWLGPDFRTRVAYNQRCDDSFIGVVQDLASGAKQILPATIYSIDNCGRHAITPLFERHAFCRPGYNYLGVLRPEWDCNQPSNDCLLTVELASGKSRPIIMVRDLVAKQPLPSMRDGSHYVEHVMHSPSGKRFAFFHRWCMADGGIFTRLYTCTADGQNLSLFPDSGIYSHLGWRTDDEFVVTGRLPCLATKARYGNGLHLAITSAMRRLYRSFRSVIPAGFRRRLIMQSKYLLFSGSDGRCRVLGRKCLSSDGHPTFRPSDSDWLITDTYPDSNGWQTLIGFHIPSERAIALGRFLSPATHSATGFRCDLHPRWDHSGNRVVVDSLATGGRQIFILDVAEALAPIV